MYPEKMATPRIDQPIRRTRHPCRSRRRSLLLSSPSRANVTATPRTPKLIQASAHSGNKLSLALLIHLADLNTAVEPFGRPDDARHPKRTAPRD